VRNDVVELARDPRALLDDRRLCFGLLVLEPPLFRRRCRIARPATQGPPKTSAKKMTAAMLIPSGSVAIAVM
jgi:hypothetical protein